MKNVLMVMIGQPGCGKTTFIKNFIAKKQNTDAINFVTVSRDEIRFSLVNENEPYFKREKIVFQKFIDRINELGKKERTTIFVDATHINEQSRKKLFNAINKDLFFPPMAIYMNTSLETSLERNRKREGTRSFVPEKVIKKMYNQKTLPSKEEGFGAYFKVEEDGTYEFVDFLK